MMQFDLVYLTVNKLKFFLQTIGSYLNKVQYDMISYVALIWRNLSSGIKTDSTYSGVPVQKLGPIL